MDMTRQALLKAIYDQLQCSEKLRPEGCAACRDHAERILDALPALEAADYFGVAH